MATQDFSYNELTPATDFTGDPANEGYRQIRTYRSATLPMKVASPEQVENPNYPGWNYTPLFSFYMVPNSPATFFAQMDAAITSEHPGTEEDAYPEAVVPALYGRNLEGSTNYYRQELPGESGVYGAEDVNFAYEIYIPALDEVRLIRTPTYYHPNADIEIFDGGAGGYTPVVVNQRLGVVVIFSPGEPQFHESMAGFTPTLPWHPDEETATGIPEIRFYDSPGFPAPLLYASTDWTTVLNAIKVPQPF